MKAKWEPYSGGTTTGTILVARNVPSAELENERDVYLYLPLSYTQSDRHYPILYMHDGQNLFDVETAFQGEWGVDETMEQLAQEGREAIVVGVSNLSEARNDEYSPFRDPKYGGGRGDDYLAFLTTTIIPMVEGEFRIAPGAENRGIMGSSLGGLISLYAFLRYPGIYGFAGVMSPAVRFADGALLGFVAGADYVPGRLYVDFGGRELGHEWGDRLLRGAFSQRYLNTVRKLVRLLEQKGYQHGDTMLYVEERQARHNEAAWARRLPEALRFLLPSLSFALLLLL